MKRLALISSALLALAMVGSPAAAQAAETPKAGWEAVSSAYPTELPPGGSGKVEVMAFNVGAADSAIGEEVTVTDTLPAGVTAAAAGEISGSKTITNEFWDCSIAAGGDTPENSVVTCHNDPANLPAITGGTGHKTAPDKRSLANQPPIYIAVEVSPSAEEGPQPNEVALSGGGAISPTTTTNLISIGSGASDFGLTRWNGWFSNADGSLDTQAGSVPYSFTTTFDLARAMAEGEVFTSAGGEPRNFVIFLPPGFIGNPTAVPQCTREQLPDRKCPKGSQVGIILPQTASEIESPLEVFNMVPPPGVPAELAFPFNAINSFLTAQARTGGDYGITSSVNNTPQREVVAVTLTLWGVPSDPSHNVWRQGAGAGCSQEGLEPGGECYLGPHPSLKPFLRLPTSCGAPPPFTLNVNTWLDPSITDEATFLAPGPGGEPSGFTGCNQEPFDPTVTAKPTTTVADAPSGLEFDLHVPQPEAVKAIEGEAKYPFEAETPGETRTIGAEPQLHEADLKQAVVTLPKGLAVNPASANGLAGCSSAQFGLTSPVGQMPITTTAAPASCPDAAKIGSVEVDTPLLDHPVSGGVYVATPKDNPFASLLAIYIAVNDEQTGTVIKLAGKVNADPSTGQLTTTFANNPQLPFEDFHLNFFKGAHASLRTPSTCATYETTSQMTPWSTPEGADAFPTDSFALTQSPTGGPCPAQESQLPDKPNFEAGTLQPKAGTYSPFLLHLARADGTQEISGIDTTLPEGLIGKLAGISECSNSQIAQAASRTGLGEGALEQSHPSCPANSLVGKASVGAGAGPSPYYTTGNAYLGGPYKGAPLSLEIITPAVAGPYDLGVVAVRTALYLNSETAQIHAVSDPIPHILQGIPLDVRSIDLELNRNQFTLNPTSCAKKQILGAAITVPGQLALLSSPFQVGDCAKLGFEPKLAIHLKGSTKRGGTPALNATLTYPAKGAYANIAKASVALPHSEFLDNAHIKTICTRVQFSEGSTPGEKCPPNSIYGFAKATTPLLDGPVEGPVYLRSSSNKLPDLVAALNGQIQVVLDGTIDSIHGGIRNRFEVVPDAPVTKFTLSMQGGKKGLLENSTNLCKSVNRATANFTAQNGLIDEYRPVVTNDCKGKAKKHGAHKKKHHGAG